MPPEAWEQTLDWYEGKPPTHSHIQFIFDANTGNLLSKTIQLLGYSTPTPINPTVTPYGTPPEELLLQELLKMTRTPFYHFQPPESWPGAPAIQPSLMHVPTGTSRITREDVEAYFREALPDSKVVSVETLMGDAFARSGYPDQMVSGDRLVTVVIIQGVFPLKIIPEAVESVRKQNDGKLYAEYLGMVFDAETGNELGEFYTRVDEMGR